MDKPDFPMKDAMLRTTFSSIFPLSSEQRWWPQKVSLSDF